MTPEVPVGCPLQAMTPMSTTYQQRVQWLEVSKFEAV